jgi:hypothetical protein
MITPRAARTAADTAQIGTVEQIRIAVFPQRQQHLLIS